MHQGPISYRPVQLARCLAITACNDIHHIQETWLGCKTATEHASKANTVRYLITVSSNMAQYVSRTSGGRLLQSRYSSWRLHQASLHADNSSKIQQPEVTACQNLIERLISRMISRLPDETSMTQQESNHQPQMHTSHQGHTIMFTTFK